MTAQAEIDNYVDELLDAYKDHTVDGKTSIAGIRETTRILLSAPVEMRVEVLIKFEQAVRNYERG